MPISYIIGQILGIVAVAIFFISYQVKNQKTLLVVQTLATAVYCVHYLLIGATSGLTLNIVCIIRNLAYYFRDKPILRGKWVPYFFAAVICVIGAFSWQGYYSLFIIIGLAINTVCLSMTDTQKVRYSVLLTCSLVLTYNVFAHSIGGVISEFVSICSAAIGIIRYRRKKAE